MPAHDAVIVDAVRTPVGKRNGSLAGVHAVNLSAHVLTALVERNGIDPAVVDDVIWGVVQQVGQQAFNVAADGRAGRGLARVDPGHHRRPPVRLGSATASPSTRASAPR
jgi:acetyl-CoA acyltransferase